MEREELDLTTWMPWVLSLLGCVCFWLAGNNKRYAWLMSLGVQVLWYVYAIGSRQWGFIPGATMFSVVYARNYWKWGKDGRSD